MYNGKKIAIIIPAFNEEKSISLVLKEIPEGVADRIVVVDNGSTDSTREEATKCGATVVTEEKKGYGAACLKGLANAGDMDIIVILDGDHSDYPEQVYRLLKPITDGESDFVLGSRVMGIRQEGALAPQAYWGNRLAVFLIKLFFKHEFTDMGPFRAIRYESLKLLNMEDQNYGWNAEMQIKAIRKGLKITEVPVDYRRRIGDSKISGTIKGTISAGSKIIYTICKYILIG